MLSEMGRRSAFTLPVLLYRLQPGGGGAEGGVLSPGPLHLPGHTRGDLQHAESQHPQQLVRHARGEGRRLPGPACRYPRALLTDAAVLLHGVDIYIRVASLIDLQLTFVKPREPFHVKHSKYSLR